MRPSEPHHKEALLRMARPCPYPEWMLLELPNGQFAAFWAQGFVSENCISVVEGRYLDGCAYCSSDINGVMDYMACNLNV